MTAAEAARRARASLTDDEIIALARKLISIPSHHDVPGKEKDVADFLTTFLADQGLACSTQPVDGDRGNVIATLPGAGVGGGGDSSGGRGSSGGRKLLFNGHLDTVPPYRMTVDPFAGEIKDGIKADGTIIGEPSNFEYAMGHRGLEWLEIEVTGKTAHGGIPAMGPSVMNFGKIEGGSQPSTVADRCIIQIDRRYIPGETVQGVIAEYQDLIDELAAGDPDFKAVIRRMPSNMMEHFDHVPMATPEGADIVQAVQAAIRAVTGAEPSITTRRGWTDAGLLGGVAGIPTVVCGPGDICASHTADEHIPVASLLKGVDLYIRAAIEFCGLAPNQKETP